MYYLEDDPNFEQRKEELVKKGKERGINVLLGEEFYFQNADNKNGHIILIAKNEKGLSNI